LGLFLPFIIWNIQNAGADDGYIHGKSSLPIKL